jgi:hypothetical protein
LISSVFALAALAASRAFRKSLSLKSLSCTRTQSYGFHSMLVLQPVCCAVLYNLKNLRFWFFDCPRLREPRIRFFEKIRIKQPAGIVSKPLKKQQFS